MNKDQMKGRTAEGKNDVKAISGKVRANKPAQKKSTTANSAGKNSATAKDALALLKADHETVKALFSSYEKAKSAKKKKSLASQICIELRVHTQVEEEILYPAIKKKLKDKMLVPEATVEHSTIKNLMTQIETEEPSDELYDAKVKVLAEYVEHHVKEEENDMFPKIQEASALDLVELGAQISARKAELLAKHGKKQSLN